MVLVWLRLCISGQEVICNGSFDTQFQNGFNHCTHGRIVSRSTVCMCETLGLNATYPSYKFNARNGTGCQRLHYANLQYSSGFDITGCKKSGVANTGCQHSHIVNYRCAANGRCHSDPISNEWKLFFSSTSTGHQSTMTDAQSKPIIFK